MKIKPSDLAKKTLTASAAAATVGNAGELEARLAEMSESSEESTTESSEPDPDTMYRTFTDQAIALIGEPTSDGRILSADIDLSFRSFPLPLMWCEQSSGGHQNSYTVGVIEQARVEGGQVLASGYLLNSEEADKAAYQNAHGVSNPSVDLADVDYVYTDKDGNELDSDELWDLMLDGEEYFVTFTKAELIGTTLVATPAFDTRIKLDAERSSRDVAIVASAAERFTPRSYDHRLFEDPKLSGPTLPTMGDDGRMYGHIAVFGECHRSVQNACVMVPRSPSNYDNFHTSPALRLDNGSRLPVGRLTVGTGHADTRLSGSPAAAHYDNTGACFALVRVGEDKHGVWFSGVAAPGATAEQIEQGISAPLSGDWRDFGRGLDLIAALAVNTPGFSVRGATDYEDRPVALVASGRLSSKSASGKSAPMTVKNLTEAVSAGVVEGMAQIERTRKDADAAAAHAAGVRELMARAREVVPAPKSTRDQVGELLAARAL